MVRSRAVTPQQLRDFAATKDQEGRAAIERGDAEAAAVAYHQANTARAAAARMETLTGRASVVHDERMQVTQEQVARGALERARTAAKSASPLHVAITHDTRGKNGGPRWRSANVYAKKRLKIAPSSLTNYTSGKLPCPRRVADAVAGDFPELGVIWKKGIVE